jgi:hypothetical protein
MIEMTWRALCGRAFGRGIDLDGVPEGSWGRIQKMIEREAGGPASHQGLTLAHFLAQLKRFPWGRGSV